MPADWLRISSLAEGRLARDIADFRPTHIVSLINPDLLPERRPRFPEDADVHQIERLDIDSDGMRAPDGTAVADMIAWLQPVVAARRAGNPVRLISHCHQGISRSTAAALTALAIYHDGDAELAIEDLLAVTNKPWPNAKIVALADAYLGLGGRLTAIVDEYRAAHRFRPRSYGRLQRRTGLYL